MSHASLRLDGCGPRGIFFFFQAEDGIRDATVTGVQTCALPILPRGSRRVIPLLMGPIERSKRQYFCRNRADRSEVGLIPAPRRLAHRPWVQTGYKLPIQEDR